MPYYPLVFLPHHLHLQLNLVVGNTVVLDSSLQFIDKVEISNLLGFLADKYGNIISTFKTHGAKNH